jgi:DNA-binding SARP family transcriptional activator
MLGPLEAWYERAPVPLGDQQQRFILVVLLLHANRPVSVERLTGIVWGDNPERRSLVRGYINKLRNAFRDADDVSIDTTATGYLLRVAEDQIDTTRFDRLRAEARASDPRRAIELLRAAVGLWRGRFLEDVDIDRVGGTDVISPADSYFDAVGDLAELELASGDHRSARDRLRRHLPIQIDRQRRRELIGQALAEFLVEVVQQPFLHAATTAVADEQIELVTGHVPDDMRRRQEETAKKWAISGGQRT